MNHPHHRFVPATIEGRLAVVFALRADEWPNEDHISRCAALLKERIGDSGGIIPDHGRCCQELILMAQEGLIVREGKTWFCLGQPKHPLPMPGRAQAPGEDSCKPS